MIWHLLTKRAWSRGAIMTLCLALLSACASSQGYRVSGDSVTYTPSGCGSCRGQRPPVARKVIGADAATFRKLGPRKPVAPSLSADYAREYGVDRSAVYYASQKIDGADPESFRFLDGAPFPQDDKAVYVGATRIASENPSRRRFLAEKSGSGYHFWVMGDTLYKQDKPWITGLDYDTFRVISKWYARDKDRIYYIRTADSIVAACDPETFSVLSLPPDAPQGFYNSYEWAKDSECAYYGDIVITEVDPASFEAVSSSIAQDSTRTYEGKYGPRDVGMQLFITPR